MTEQKEPRRRGCLLYGLLIFGVIFVAVIAGMYLGTRKAVRYAIENYTTNAPVTIPLVTLPANEQRSIATSLLKQFEAAANGQGPAELAIGEQELNVLIAQAPDLRPYDRHVYLQPQENDLKAFVSMPLDQFPQWEKFAQRMGGTNYSHRFLNGLAYVNLVVTNGLLKVAPRKMVVSAKTLPDQFIKQFPWDTLTQPINENANFRSALQRVGGISVRDGKVYVKFKR